MWIHEFRLDRAMEADGDGWLPGSPQRRVYGKLKFSTETGIVLELGHSLIPQPDLGPTEPQTVHGEIDDDIPVTLFNAVSGFVLLRGPRTPPITATGLLVGHRANSPDD